MCVVSEEYGITKFAKLWNWGDVLCQSCKEDENHRATALALSLRSLRFPCFVFFFPCHCGSEHLRYVSRQHSLRSGGAFDDGDHDRDQVIFIVKVRYPRPVNTQYILRRSNTTGVPSVVRKQRRQQRGYDLINKIWFQLPVLSRCCAHLCTQD